MEERAKLGRSDTTLCSIRLFAPFRSIVQRTSARVCHLAEVDIDQRVPHRAVMACLEQAVSATRDPSLGLKAAQKTRPETFDLLEYLAGTAPTLLAGVEAASQNLGLLHDGGALSVRAFRDEVSMRFSLASDLAHCKELSEFALASMLLSLRRLAGDEFAPLRVHFRHPAPRDRSQYADVFRCPVEFGADDDLLVLDAEAMRRPLASADAGLHALLARSASERLDALARRQTFALRVRELIAAELPQGTPSVARVCRMLGMSERSLNRRLADEDTTFRALLDSLRRQLAVQYLEDTRCSLEEIALLLGFSHSAAFHRAFRRWMGGDTPTSYRRRATEEARKAVS